LGLLLGGALFAVAHVAAGQPAGYSVFQLVSPEVHDAEFFGRSVASLGPDLVIGAPGWVADGTQPGRVYVMSPMGNVRLTIENPTPAGGDEFGAAVAVVGANILVGAPFDDTAGPDTGAAYLFDGATGVLLQTFLVPGAVPNAQCARDDRR